MCHFFSSWELLTSEPRSMKTFWIALNHTCIHIFLNAKCNKKLNYSIKESLFYLFQTFNELFVDFIIYFMFSVVNFFKCVNVFLCFKTNYLNQLESARSLFIVVLSCKKFQCPTIKGDFWKGTFWNKLGHVRYFRTASWNKIGTKF